MKALNSRDIAPEFHRIPHFNKEISNATHDDILNENEVKFPLECWIQEKIDGAQMKISWYNGNPILGNREHILRKGYSKIKTNAKKQFTSAWNWLHEHEKDIRKVEKMWQSPVTIYGDWCFASHSIYYDKLPDIFIAYDIWSVEDAKYLAPDIVANLLLETDICFIAPEKITFNTIQEVIDYSEKQSEYRTGIREGIVIKTSEKEFLKDTFKVVNKHFKLRQDFNESNLVKNKILK